MVDADLDGPVPWLATSYVAGPSLASAVVNGGPMPVGSVLALTAGLAEGLSAIHAAGVVHRDLKPSNVIVADDGPRVLDFGISLSAEASALTQTGMVVGSPGFMSPEQADGRDVGPPSDIFSLGAVLAFAATGQGPFGTGSTAALVYRVVHSEPDTAALPDEIRPLIERCLAKDPRHRPTAPQVLEEVSAGRPAAGPLLLSAPVHGARPGQAPAGPAGTVDADTPPVHPPTEQVGVPGSAPVGTPIPPTTTSPTRLPPDGGQAARPEPRRWSRRWLLASAAVLVLAGAAAGAFFAARADHVNGDAAASAGRAHGVKPRPLAASATPTTPASASATQASSSQTSASGPQSSGASSMATLGSYLEQSASVRPSVQAAIDGVQTCSESPASGEATIQQAIDTRQRILSGLQTLSAPGLPHGPRLVSDLSAAMENSVAADRDYQSWMADSTSSGGCGSNPAQDSNYQAGQTASAEATAAKNNFLDIWNPMAPSYGQQTYSSTDF